MRRIGSTTAAAITGICVGAAFGLLILTAIWLSVRPTTRPPSAIPPVVDQHISRSADQGTTTSAPAAADSSKTDSAPAGSPAVLQEKIEAIPEATPASLPGNMLVAPDEVELLRKKLRQIAIGMLNFHDQHRGFPPGKLKDTRLSWRVQLLPYLEQRPLYERFHLDEPWDSPHNHALLEFMPDVYRTGDEPTNTRFKVFSGERTLFAGQRPSSFARVSDGTSNTLLVVHIGGGEAVPWTKPIDVVFDPINPLAALGFINGRIEGILTDATPISLPGDVAPTLLSALITPAGGEIVDGHGLSRKYEVASRAASPDGGQVTALASQGFERETLGRLKTIALAMLEHEQRSRTFPPAVSYRMKDGIPGLEMSWRVRILPFLEQQALFSRYNREEAWNGASNRGLLQHMPGYYRRTGDSSETSTRIQVFTGAGTAFDPATKDGSGNPLGPTMRGIPDGAHRTILAIETGPEVIVPWMQPKDIVFTPHDPLGNIGAIEHTGIPVVHFDGAGKILSPDIDPEVFKSMVLSGDGK